MEIPKALLAEWERKLLEDPTILREDKAGCLRKGNGKTSRVTPEEQLAHRRYHELAAQVSADRTIRWPSARCKTIWDLHALEGFGRVEIERRTGANHREIAKVVAFGEARMPNVKHVRTAESHFLRPTRQFQRYHRPDAVTKRMVAALEVREVLRLALLLTVTHAA